MNIKQVETKCICAGQIGITNRCPVHPDIPVTRIVKWNTSRWENTIMNEGQEVSSQIEKKSVCVGESISSLEESVGELGRRLEPVMVASRKEDESKDAVERPAISPLGGQLDAWNLRLQGIHSSVTDILDRLDL